jgi:hypothetical protein
MRKLAIAVVTAAAVLAGPAAYAQQNAEDPLQLKYEAERRQQQEVEKEYNATMKRTQRGTGETAKADPWGIVRTLPSQAHQSKDKPR